MLRGGQKVTDDITKHRDALRRVLDAEKHEDERITESLDSVATPSPTPTVAAAPERRAKTPCKFDCPEVVKDMFRNQPVTCADGKKYATICVARCAGATSCEQPQSNEPETQVAASKSLIATAPARQHVASAAEGVQQAVPCSKTEDTLCVELPKVNCFAFKKECPCTCANAQRTVVAAGGGKPHRRAAQSGARAQAQAGAAPRSAAKAAHISADPAGNAHNCDAHAPLYRMIDQNLEPFFKRGVIETQEENFASNERFFELFKEKRMSDQHDLVTIVQIVNNKLYCVPHDGRTYKYKSACYPSGANFNRIYFVLDLLNRTLAEFELPDSQFMISTNDVPMVDKFIFDKGAIPTMFCLGKSDREYDIIMPGQSFTSGSWGLTWPDWLSKKNQMALDEKYPWKTKKEVAFWRGHEQINLPMMLPLRLKASTETKKGPDAKLFDIDMVGGYVPGYKYADKVEMFDHAAYKYLVHLDGSTVSSRLMKLLAANSVVLKHESPWYEFFEAALIPGYHYIPFHWDGDLESGDRWDGAHQNLTAQVHWAMKNDAEARAIGARGREFALTHLNIPAVKCYIRRLMTKYAKLFKGGFKVHEKAEPFGAGTLFTEFANIMGNFKPGNWLKGKQ